MNRLFSTAILASTLCACSLALADEQVSENRNIDARVVRVKLGGVIELHVRQGATASLVITGERDDVQRVTTRQNGDTLDIDMDSHFSFHRNQHGMRAELTLPNLQELDSGGVGATDINGFSGSDIKLSLGGAGAVKLTSHYQHVRASMTGVGSVTLNTGDSDSIDVSMHGAGHMLITGQSKTLRAKLGGVGGLDAKQLIADAVDLDMTGLGGAKVYAKNSADVSLSGLGSATIYGKPVTRHTSAHGLGSVNWD